MGDEKPGQRFMVERSEFPKVEPASELAIKVPAVSILFLDPNCASQLRRIGIPKDNEAAPLRDSEYLSPIPRGFTYRPKKLSILSQDAFDIHSMRFPSRIAAGNLGSENGFHVNVVRVRRSFALPRDLVAPPKEPGVQVRILNPLPAVAASQFDWPRACARWLSIIFRLGF
jgi:hypothetical protein